MHENERIQTIEAKYQSQLQQKNEVIIDLEAKVAKFEQELQTQEGLVSRYADELSRTRNSLNGQLDRLAEAKVDEIARTVKELLGVRIR